MTDQGAEVVSDEEIPVTEVDETAAIGGALAPEDAATEAEAAADDAVSEDAPAHVDEAPAEPSDDASDDASDDPMVAFRAELISREGDWFVIHSYSGHEKRVK